MTGFWSARVIGVPEAAAGEAAPASVVAQLGDRRDPGYWSTARMVLEAGLTLALNVRAGLQPCFCRQGGPGRPRAGRQPPTHLPPSSAVLPAAPDVCERVCMTPHTWYACTHACRPCVSVQVLRSMPGVGQEGELKATGRQPGGVLTAASALGVPLVQRLRDAGFTLEIKE